MKFINITDDNFLKHVYYMEIKIMQESSIGTSQRKLKVLNNFEIQDI